MKRNVNKIILMAMISLFVINSAHAAADLSEKERVASILADVLKAYNAYYEKALSLGWSPQEYHNFLGNTGEHSQEKDILDKQCNRATELIAPAVWPASTAKDSPLRDNQLHLFKTMLPNSRFSYERSKSSLSSIVKMIFSEQEKGFYVGIYKDIAQKSGINWQEIIDKNVEGERKFVEQELKSIAPYLESLDSFKNIPVLNSLENDVGVAKKLIVMVVGSTAFAKGIWYPSYGLLGAFMIGDMYYTLAYESLFASIFASGNTVGKMEATLKTANDLVIDRLGMGSERPTELRCKSWIYWREHYIGKIAYEIENRFSINKEGEYEQVLEPYSEYYTSSFNKFLTSALVRIVPNAYEAYKQIKERGYTDETLGDAIGIGNAILQYDGMNYLDNPYLLPFSRKDYYEVVTSVIESIRNSGSSPFSALHSAMQSRGMASDDNILLPSNNWNHVSCVKLIIEDLDTIVMKQDTRKVNRVKEDKTTSFSKWYKMLRDKTKKTIDVWTNNKE